MKLSAAEIARILEAPCGIGPAWEAPLEMVCIDSREAGPGSLFVCIKGEKADGHDFAAAAARAGAGAALCEKPITDPGIPCIMTGSSVQALGKLARAWREKTGATVIGVTGTAGKTTLKETLKAIFSEAGATHATAKNHNNQIGLPLSILAASGNEKFWILEAGISKAGDMDELGAILAPDIAVILNAGVGHCEGLGGKGVAWHKARLLEHVRRGGQGIVSCDYPELLREARASRTPTLHFGKGPEAACSASPAGSGKYLITTPDCAFEVSTPFNGAWGAELASAASICALACGLSPEQIQAGFAKASTAPQRFAHVELDGWVLIDDTYNANPLSMARMLEAAREEAGTSGYLACVLGEMGELGQAASALHCDLGAKLAPISPDLVFWKGGFFENVRAGFLAAGGAAPFLPCPDSPSFIAQLSGMELPRGRKHILFKGSRANRLEEFVETFKQFTAQKA